ncbi:MAG TPA: type II secretion system F family protein [Polyangiaceae bacterium]|nr:type II secretion system F family protein [Polyangiaceae bacterium]
MAPLSTLQWAGGILLLLGLFVAVFAIARDPESLPYRGSALYVAYLDRKLRNLFMNRSGKSIALGQAAVLVVLTIVVVWFKNRCLAAALLAVPFGPALYLEFERRRRVRAIESTLDAFTLTLANALRATPSIGNALAYAQRLVPAPLNQELELALKEMRVGSTVEQALLNLAGRVQSTQLDATLSSVMIGRQVGGDLIQILETTALTLREMARLEGVVRSKTAEGKAQLALLAAFPGLVVVLFEWVSPSYFEPLNDNLIGWIVLGATATLWTLALVLARSVLSVDL